MGWGWYTGLQPVARLTQPGLTASPSFHALILAPLKTDQKLTHYAA
jgi:hypothetical protein